MPESLGGEGFRVFTSIYYNLGNCLLNYGRDCHFLNPESLGGEGLRAIPHFEGSFGVICEGFPPLFESNGCSVGWRGGGRYNKLPPSSGRWLQLRQDDADHVSGAGTFSPLVIGAMAATACLKMQALSTTRLSVPLSSGRWLQPRPCR